MVGIEELSQPNISTCQVFQFRRWEEDKNENELQCPYKMGMWEPHACFVEYLEGNWILDQWCTIIKSLEI